jgi:hypothetical protein
LREVYRILFKQWERVFADENRRRGHRAEPLAKIFSEIAA